MVWQLEVTDGPNYGAKQAVTGTGLLVGRDPNQCSLVLTDGKVSRLHARIFISGSGQVFVEDLGSTYGTYVNGLRLGGGAQMLRPGDELRLGDTTIRLIQTVDQKKSIFHAPAGIGLRNRGTIIALMLVTVAIIGVATFFGLRLHQPGFDHIGSWQGELDGVLLYIRFRTDEKATLVLPWFGDVAEQQYRISRQKGEYKIEIYSIGNRAWNELCTVKPSSENSFTLVNGATGAQDSFNRITEDEFNSVLARAETKDPYLSYRSAVHTDLLSIFVVLESLLENPGYSAQWEEDFKVTLALLKVICAEILESSSPEQHAASHLTLQSAASQYSLAVDCIIARENERAGQYLSIGDRYYQEANRLLQ